MHWACIVNENIVQVLGYLIAQIKWALERSEEPRMGKVLKNLSWIINLRFLNMTAS